jgi:hypothetical protein
LMDMIGPSFLGNDHEGAARPDGRAVIQLSVGGGVYYADRARGTKKGPREAPADRVERSNCPSGGSLATWTYGATSGPALWAGEGRCTTVVIQCGGSFLCVSTQKNAHDELIRRDAWHQIYRTINRWQPGVRCYDAI